MLNIISWNVNGIRAVVRKGFIDFLKKEKPDILCLQEIKINDQKRELEKFDFKNYQEFWNSAKKPGYAGTAILTKNIIPTKITNGVSNQKFDDEGRVQITDFDKFYLVNAYFPHTRHDLSRLDFKLEFNDTFLKNIKKLDKKKPVILTGDFNVAHEEIDLARPKDNMENPGFLPQERAWASKLIKAGFVDTYRFQNPKKIQYSWWSHRFKAREKNIGWRIDYFFVSDRIKAKVKTAYILDQIKGSDHCPVGIKIDM